MKTRMTILAALFGLAMFAAPAVASAHPAPAWRRAEMAQHFQTLGPKERYMFMRQHPYLARNRAQLINGYGYQNGTIGEQPFAYGPGTWGQNPGYMNQQMAGMENGGYGRPQCQLQNMRGGYRGGYGARMGGYGYGGQQYGSNYGMLGTMLPMLGNYMR